MNTNDLKVIQRLMEQARATWAELGTLLGLSAPAAADRVRKLEELGVIKGYAALIDPDAIGCGLAALISVTLDRPEQKLEFLETVNRLAEIQECHHIAGAEDYVLKVRCASTRDLERLITEEIKSLPGTRTRTTVILSTVKETPILPLKIERR
ncbi:Lrp/AsnC family transcriptional regulator [Sporomusa malonica]|uniref:Lrp/AsnC family transcriptional regulator, leucine-responsive regulatory protein n=1 Tax=Sporomusa malonica TaxID=112901 RepID=A0A1W1YH03_9FIRM|nr:Lrp/AsnC family transcriptional regulator [Sporomusa malonica]SMC35008.1 Lrp/AsnC family transcriptional regulator, leucine-responsive regulatory protein [Sporomusa malonica]